MELMHVCSHRIGDETRGGDDPVFAHATDLFYSSIRQDYIDAAELMISSLEQFEDIVPARSIAFTEQNTTANMLVQSGELHMVTDSTSSDASSSLLPRKRRRR